MGVVPARRFLVSVLLAAMAFAGSTVKAQATVVPYGQVLVPGAAWAGSLASLGDLNVYSNGNGHEQGSAFQCTELATRFARVVYGAQGGWSGPAYKLFDSGPSVYPTPFLPLANGGAEPPKFGDILILDHTAYNSTGHAVVVSGTGPGYVDIVEQNWGNYAPTGRARLTIQGTFMPNRVDGNPGGLPIRGWLRAWTTPLGDGAFTLDQYGGVHPNGGAPPVRSSATWPKADMARGLAVGPDGTSGLVLDSWGGLHTFGTARTLADAPVAGGYWPHWDIARSVVLNSTGDGGYTLDGLGGIHSFGTAPARTGTAYWNWDIGRGMALNADGKSGYVLDGYGGLHPFGGAAPLKVSAYWLGWDIARGVTLNSTGTGGYVLDGFGGLHPFGDAAPAAPGIYWPGKDRARGLFLHSDTSGYVVDAYGYLIPFGGAPALSGGPISTTLPVGRGVGASTAS